MKKPRTTNIFKDPLTDLIDDLFANAISSVVSLVVRDCWWCESKEMVACWPKKEGIMSFEVYCDKCGVAQL